MGRTTLTALVRAKGGKILHSSHNHANYVLPLSEEKFLDFRATIPFLTVWHRGNAQGQYFAVFFDELK